MCGPVRREERKGAKCLHQSMNMRQKKHDLNEYQMLHDS